MTQCSVQCSRVQSRGKKVYLSAVSGEVWIYSGLGPHRHTWAERHTGTQAHMSRGGLHRPPGVKILMNHLHSTLFTSLSPVVTITTFPWHQHLCVVSHPPPFSLNCSAVQRIPQHSAFAPISVSPWGAQGSTATQWALPNPTSTKALRHTVQFTQLSE